MRVRSAIFLAVFIGFFGAPASARHVAAAGPSTADDVLRIGLALQPTNALVIVALDRGYFAEQELMIAVTDYPSGKIALKTGLFAGKADLVTASDVPIALSGFQRHDFKIIATVYAVNNQNRVIARKDRGIVRPDDLRGKRIATQSASAVHFFLSQFLAGHGIAESDVQLSFLAAERLPGALAYGAIDGFAMREPYIGRARAFLGDNAVIFDAPGLYDQTDQIVVSDALVDKRPSTVVKILRALVRAEEYVKANPAQAQKTIAERLHVLPARIAANWPRRPPRVSLEQSLLSRLEVQARWAIQSKLVKGSALPNYLDVIHLQSLVAVRPRVVTVVR